MKKPVIGLVALGSSLFRRYMQSKYVNALKSEGAEVKILPWAATTEQAKAALADCDGLLLPGGGDIDPKFYGEEPHEKCGKPHVQRDKAEPLFLAEAMRRNMPVLGICRGIQMINAALGGTLWQDIGEIDGEHVKHSDFWGRGRAVHKVNVQAGTKLAQYAKAVQGVNTIHHQAANTLAPGFVCAAVSEDGVIEAIEKPDYPFMLGVQWHPEHLYGKSESANKIFAGFVEACEEYAGKA